MQKVVALIVVLLGAVLMVKTLAATWLLLLVLAAAFAWGASTRAIGRWGYMAALVCALLALPGFIMRTVLASLGFALVLVKFFGIPLLILLGLYMLVRSFRK